MDQNAAQLQNSEKAPQPQPGKVQKLPPIWPLVVLGIMTVVLAVLVLAPSLDLKAPSSSTTPTVVVGVAPDVRFSPEQPAAGYYTDAPLNILVEIPAFKVEGEDFEPSEITVALLDGANGPATFGGKTGGPQQMRPESLSAKGRPIWSASLTTPSLPGVYKLLIDANEQGKPLQSFAPDTATITVISGTTPLLSGFIYPRADNLWLTASDGSRTRKLTFNPYGEPASDPEWSLDGSLIAYTHGVAAATGGIPTNDIHIFDPGTGQDRLAVEHRTGEGLAYPSWAPGGRILFTADRLIDPDTGETPSESRMAAADEAWSIEQVNLATGERTAVVQEAVMPHVSNDGLLLAYVKRTINPADPQSGALTSIVVAEGNGANPRVLVRAGQFGAIYRPRISPDNKLVAFAAVNFQDGSAAGGDWMAQLRDFLVPRAYAQEADSTWDIYLVPVEGGEPRRVTRMESLQPSVSWGNSASEMAVLADGGLFIVTPDGGDPRRIAAGQAQSHVSWYQK